MKHAVLLLALTPVAALAQSLEPRLYVPLPVSANIVIASYAYSTGNVVFDAALPITDFTTEMHSVTAAFVRTFGLAGRSAQVQVVVPVVDGLAEGVVSGQDTSRELHGLADPEVRLAVNLAGGPARRRTELAGVRFGTIVGASLSVKAPLGQYDPARMLNVGANRWSAMTELGIVQPLARSWAIEGYAGVWLYGRNTEYHGATTLTQEPLWTLQSHLIRLLGRRGFVALDGTLVYGGTTSVDGVVQNTLQRNTRFGATGAWSVRPGHTVKAAISTGVYTRFGGDFSVISVGYQRSWGG
jgi:hypothetical protein